jgi:hypothetical protein
LIAIKKVEGGLLTLADGTVWRPDDATAPELANWLPSQRVTLRDHIGRWRVISNYDRKRFIVALIKGRA